MSKTPKKASVAVPDDHSSNSVYDFLYCDVRRVGSFLAQSDASGHLTQVIQSISTVEGTSSRAGASVVGSIAVVKGDASFQDEESKGITQRMDQTYDPLWTNARTFLDFLTERNMIQRDLSKARLGQFVLISGTLSIQQFSLMTGFWALPTTKSLAHESMANTIKKHAKPGIGRADLKKQLEQGKMNVEKMLEILPFLPHGPQAIIRNDDASAWGSIFDQYITGSSSDLVLKHGGSVSGIWHMLSILDALPDTIEGPSEVPYANLISGLEDGARILNKNMMLVARRTLGRPESTYGVTPILIFRNVSG